MIKNIIHITFISYVWKRYKVIILSTVALFFAFWLIGKLHQDFVSYSHLNDDKQYIALSFLIKWLAYLSGIVIYFGFNARYRFMAKHKETDKNPITAKPSKKNKRSSTPSDTQDYALDKKDAFADIRKKENLRSTADFIIEKNKKP